jgi:FMN phosphatase YigB (HAD superfamily)
VTLRRLGVHPDQTLYVGDRHDVDAPAARAAGVQCIIVGRQRNPNRAAAEGWITVSDYSELHKLLFSDSPAS